MSSVAGDGAGPAGQMLTHAVDAKITLKGWEDHEQHKCAILDSRGTLKGTVGELGKKGG